MSSNDSVEVKAVWSDERNTIINSLRGSDNTVAMAVGIACNHISQHISKCYGLEPPLDPLAIQQVKYIPSVKPSDMLSVCHPDGLTLIITPNADAKRRIKNHLKLGRNAQANQTPVEPNTTLAMPDTATTSEPSTVPPRKSKNARKRNAASRADSTSTANPPHVTMDSQLKEMLASMQKEIAEIRGKNESMRNDNERILGENERILGENERILGENERILSKDESMRGEIERITNENESLRKDNERINNDLAVIRKDLDAAGVQHTQDVEALREVTMSLVPLHLRVLLDRARRKVLEHLGHETWEGLRDSRSVYQLSNIIFDALKRQGVSYTPSHQSILFLCSYNNIRRAGNTVAHSAKENDVRHAVLTQPLESCDRECLENLFTYAYDGKEL